MKQQQGTFVQESDYGHEFGTLLKVLRVSKQVKQNTIVALLPGWSRTSYTRLESGELPPHFDQLYAIYRAFQLAGISFTLEARQQFLDFARTQIEKKKTHRDKHSDSEWAELRYQLARLDGSALNGTIEQLPQKSSVVHRPLLAETSHLIGREEWQDHLLSLLTANEPKKLVIIRGPAGIGKSSELNWLATYLFRQRLTSYRVILCDFRSLERVGGPEEAFEVFLGTLLTEFGLVQPQTALLSWDERTRQVLEQLEKGARPTVILLDHCECMLQESGLLAACWERFLTKFLRSKHLTTLVGATKQWPGWYEGEQQFVAELPLPPLSVDKGVLVLQHLGLEHVPVSLLQDIYSRTGGIPLCLEWVAALVKQPLFADDWEEFTSLTQDNERDSQRTMIDAIHRLLQEPHLFGGSVADELAPFLERILSTQRLSLDANALLQTLSVATLPLAKPALQVLCPQGSRPLKELRRASVLVAYPDRAQLLPTVAAAMYRRLSSQEIDEREAQLITAYTSWLQGDMFHEREQGILITELAILLIKQHHLLDAAQLLIRYGWLSFNMGYAPRIAHLASDVLRRFDWHSTKENECGGLILSYFLPPFLGTSIDPERRFKDYQYMYKIVLAEGIVFPPFLEVHVTHFLMLHMMNSLDFEEAKALLDAIFLRLEEPMKTNRDLQSSLLEKRAMLFGTWSEYAEEQGELQKARTLQQETIALYKQIYTLLSSYEETLPLVSKRQKKRIATCLTNLGYELNRIGQYEEAFWAIEGSITLKEQGYTDVGALAAAYGEKSQTLMELGRFQEALLFDEKAFGEIRRLVNAKHVFSQEEVWIYQVNRGRLYLRMGKVKEAEQLLREALPNIHPRRRIYKMFAKEALAEIDQQRQKTNTAHYQLDWRWVDRYRELDAYDAYWWWAQAGPFDGDELQQWNHLYHPYADEATKEQLGRLIARSREREVACAIAEQREPRLHYPALDIGEVRRRIAGLHHLMSEIDQDEANPVVRRLYHGAIEEEITFISMIEATYDGKSEQYQELNRQLGFESTREELEEAFSYVQQFVQQGLQYRETVDISHKLIHFFEERLHRGLDLVTTALQEVQAVSSLTKSKRFVSARTVQRFFEAILRESGYEGWQVMIDPKANGPRVEGASRRLFIGENDLSLDDVIHYLVHEIGGHATRGVAGEQTVLGLLGLGTQGYLITEEGLSLYDEHHIETRYKDAAEDWGLWLGTLATGLAGGILTPPQTFLSLYTFLELLFVLRRLLEHPNEDRETAQRQAQKVAMRRCLRTYRGVPNLEHEGVFFGKDVCYLRGLRMIECAVAQDETVLDRLTVGKIALEHLPEMQELGITTLFRPVWRRGNDPHLEAYILSFEESEQGALSPSDR